MKPIRICLLILFLCSGQDLFSQARLSITNIQGLPSGGQDSAYFNSPYDSIQVTIKNTGNSIYQGEADVLIMGNRGVVDTLYTDSINGTILQPNDSVNRFPPSYLFTSVHYVDGDNIVVVWPQARTTGILSDTISFHLYYVSLLSVPELNKGKIIISPNPGTDYIRLGLKENKQFDYVRIFDNLGQLIYASESSQQTIFVKNWKAGIYFIEIQAGNSSYSGKLVVQ